MTKRFSWFVLGVIALGTAAYVAAEESPLAVLKDVAQSEFLATLEQVAQWKKPPFHVKVFKSYERGECDGSPHTCPKVRLYVTASAYDEAPDVKVFVPSPAYAWDFVEWEEVPTGESRGDYMVLVFRRKVLGSDPQKSWFAYELVRMKVNPWSGSIAVIGDASATRP